MDTVNTFYKNEIKIPLDLLITQSTHWQEVSIYLCGICQEKENGSDHQDNALIFLPNISIGTFHFRIRMDRIEYLICFLSLQ